MIFEPLKNKKIQLEEYSEVFKYEHVESAVEWLKELIYCHDWSPEEITKSKVMDYIDEAFPEFKK